MFLCFLFIIRRCITFNRDYKLSSCVVPSGRGAGCEIQILVCGIDIVWSAMSNGIMINPSQGPIGALQFQTGSGGFSGSALVLYDFTNDVMTLRSGLVHARTAVTTNHTAAVDEYYLGIRSASLEILFDATQCANGQTYIIKDEIGGADVATPITLKPSASQTMDNASSVTIASPYGAVHLYTDGTNWFIY